MRNRKNTCIIVKDTNNKKEGKEMHIQKNKTQLKMLQKIAISENSI